MVNLRRIDEATERDKLYKLDKWCRLITASSWEEAKEIAKEDPLMEATIKKLYYLDSDFEMREEAIRRRDYYNYVHSLEREIVESKSVIAEKDFTIAELKRQLELLKQSK